MMDLREFLKVLEEEHELQKIKVEVDSKHELGAICKIHNKRRDSPALLFEKVKGHRVPVVGQCGITSSLEPSATVDGLTSKLMLDLTIKKSFRGEVAERTASMRENVLKRSKEYGFK